MKSAVLGVLLIAGCSGCATFQTDVTAGLDKAHYVLGALFSVAHPLIDAKCREEAVSCVDQGVARPQDCPGYLKCEDVRTAVGKSLVAAERAIQAGQKAVAMGDEDSAAGYAAKALEIAEDVRRALVEAGVIK